MKPQQPKAAPTPTNTIDNSLDEILNRFEYETTRSYMNVDSRTRQAVKASAKAAINKTIMEADGCPCLLVEPCHYACSCAKPIMSGGCWNCCKYGSKEQRIEAAKRLSSLTKKYGRADNEN